MDSVMVWPRLQSLTSFGIGMRNSEKHQDQQNAKRIDHRDASRKVGFGTTEDRCGVKQAA
jgi:hypothetical protein